MFSKINSNKRLRKGAYLLVHTISVVKKKLVKDEPIHD